LTTIFFDVAKFPMLMQTLIPKCQFENNLSPHHCVKISQQNFHMVLMKLIKKNALILHNCLLNHQFAPHLVHALSEQ